MAAGSPSTGFPAWQLWVALSIAAMPAFHFVEVAVAQPATTPPVLHEPIAPLAPAPTTPAKAGEPPSAITAGGDVLPKPAVDAPSLRQAGPTRQPVLGTSDFSADRATSMKPDRNTGPDRTLHYVSVFNPDVLPWKRMSALDEISDDFTLRVHRGATTEIAVGGIAAGTTRDAFWGDVMVELRPGLEVALPSVAPDMRILAYETNPKLRLIFSKDGADNFYVRSDESNAIGTVHLVFNADANAGYFAPQPPPRRYRVREMRAIVPPEIRVRVPAPVMRQAEVTLSQLGLSPEHDVTTALNTLVAWGRGFTPGEIRNPTGNVYRDLCDSKVGVCRHRSFAFMVTANALGIPTRVVQNEAHAFIEVWLPERGWQRIDLGGAAMQLDVTGANAKQLHRPRSTDPFDKPPEYQRNYTQLQGNIRGLTAQQRAAKPASAGNASSSSASGGARSRTPTQTGTESPLAAPKSDPAKPTPTLAITRVATSAYRGDVLDIEGTIRVGNRVLADRVIAVYLSTAATRGDASVHLGSLRSTADGSFQGKLPLPANLALARYRVFATTPEDATYNAARSN